MHPPALRGVSSCLAELLKCVEARMHSCGSRHTSQSFCTHVQHIMYTPSWSACVPTTTHAPLACTLPAG